MIEKTIYICEHCNRKQLKTRNGMAKHELICWYNLENKTCMTCRHGALLESDKNDYERVRKCFRDSEEGITFETIRPIENCKHWQCSTEYLNRNSNIPTPEEIADTIKKFNELNYWCELSIKDNNINLTNREIKDTEKLIEVDGVDKFKLNKTMLEVIFTECEEGFCGCIISESAIEYY